MGGNLCDSCLHVHFPPYCNTLFNRSSRRGVYSYVSLECENFIDPTNKTMFELYWNTAKTDPRPSRTPSFKSSKVFPSRTQQGLQKEICLMEYKQQHSNLVHDGETAVLAFKPAPNERRSEIIKHRWWWLSLNTDGYLFVCPHFYHHRSFLISCWWCCFAQSL